MGDNPDRLMSKAAATGYDLTGIQPLLYARGRQVNWAQLGGSIAAILALAGIARWLRLGESRIGSVAEAREIAEDMLVGFRAHDALVSLDGGAAIVAGNGASRGAQPLLRGAGRRAPAAPAAVIGHRGRGRP